MSMKSAISIYNMIFKEKSLVITPLLDPGKQLKEGSASVDLRLGTRFITSRRGDLTHIDTGDKSYSQKVPISQDEYYKNIGKEFVLHPGHFVLATTLEYLSLPPNLAGNVVTRSSWGRHGLIIATAIAIHPGYTGILTLELRNLAEVPLVLYPGRRILQVFFYEVDKVKKDSFDMSPYLASTKPSTGDFRSEHEEIDLLEKYPNYKGIAFSL